MKKKIHRKRAHKEHYSAYSHKIVNSRYHFWETLQNYLCTFYACNEF